MKWKMQSVERRLTVSQLYPSLRAENILLGVFQHADLAPLIAIAFNGGDKETKRVERVIIVSKRTFIFHP